MFGQQSAVGGQGDINAGNFGQHGDELVQVAAHQRLAAGEADFAHALADENFCQARHLFKRQDLTAFEVLVVRAEDFLRHAVDAAEVTPVGDGDAEVAEGAVEGVGEGHGREGVIGNWLLVIGYWLLVSAM